MTTTINSTTVTANEIDATTKFVYSDDSEATVSGKLLQMVSMSDGEVATGTTLVPNDDTIPQNTEGTEFMTLAITPKSATSKLIIRSRAYLSHGTANRLIFMMLFQDSIANALAVSGVWEADPTAINSATLEYVMTSGTTSEIIFKIRIGSQGSGTLTFNGESGVRTMGGVANSGITIEEISA